MKGGSFLNTNACVRTMVGKDEISVIGYTRGCMKNKRLAIGIASLLFMLMFLTSCMVPRDGIEPPTRGFSVLCSTD
jgi:hypothetical protein